MKQPTKEAKNEVCSPHLAVNGILCHKIWLWLHLSIKTYKCMHVWTHLWVCTCRVRSSAEAWGMVLYICPSISLSWDTMGAKSWSSVFTDFSKMAHTAWGRTWDQRLVLIAGADLLLTWGYVTHLDNLRVVEPLTEYGLYESKHLLQNHHHLKKTHLLCFICGGTDKLQRLILVLTHECTHKTRRKLPIGHPQPSVQQWPTYLLVEETACHRVPQYKPS